MLACFLKEASWLFCLKRLNPQPPKTKPAAHDTVDLRATVGEVKKHHPVAAVTRL